MSGNSYSDRYHIPHHPGVMWNNLNITEGVKLRDFEVLYASVNFNLLNENPVQGSYDLEHLCKIHYCLFGDIYPWAGEIRTIDIAKNQTVFLWCHKIEDSANFLFSQIPELFENKSLPAALAEIWGRLNYIHPFPEGNGRTQRTFINQLAKERGLEINWSSADFDKYNIKASILAEKGDYSMFETIIANNSKPIGMMHPFRRSGKPHIQKTEKDHEIEGDYGREM